MTRLALFSSIMWITICLSKTPACDYCGHIDERIHALVHHAHHGKDKDIPYLCCQACQTVFSSRKGTPLYYLKTKAERVEMVLWFLVKGVDLAVMVRYTGHKGATIARWLERMGQPVKVCTTRSSAAWY